MVYNDVDHSGIATETTGESAVTRILRVLEHDILTHRLKPRERLIERDLVEQFSLSRSPIREALTRLEAAGLITSAGKRGYIVRDYTSAEVLQLYYLRTVLERAAVPLVIDNISEEQISKVALINDEFRKAFDDRDVPRMIELNSDFHRSILQSCGNEFLSESLEKVRMKVFCCRYSLFIAWPISEKSITDHDQMLIALRSRDAAKYEELVIAHMSAGKERYLELANVL